MPACENKLKNKKKEKLVDEPAEPINGPAFGNAATATIGGRIRSEGTVTPKRGMN
jgi:hypothetical protein